MHIGVIGYTGFIGTNLINSLSTNYSSIPLSLRSNDWQGGVHKTGILINLVGKAHDHKGTATEADYYYANVDLTKEIFREFLLSKAKLLIHVSSLAALEEFQSDKFLEEKDFCNPQSWYGKSKRAAEEWLLSQEIPKGKKLIIVRPPMVHGPGDKGNLGLLYKLISKGIPYPLAAFDNSRSFISIDNFTFFIKQIIERYEVLENGIYHIADDEPISTHEIINIIKTENRKTIPNIALPKFWVRALAKIGDILPIPLNTKRLKKMTSDLLVSNAKIKKALGINNLPLTAKEGLTITIKSFKQHN